MKRSRLVALVVSGMAAVALALVTAATAVAAPPFTIQATTHYPGLNVTLSGTGPAFHLLSIHQFADSSCSQAVYNEHVVATATNGVGAYATDYVFETAGTHYVQAHVFGEDWMPASNCLAVTVGAAAWPTSSGPDHYGYCTVAGNTNPASGTPYGANTFVLLHMGEPASIANFTGATPAFWVEGVGVTCDLTPAQAAIAAASTTKVNHVGATTPEEGPPFYTFVPAP